jgi:trafficking protein particle complex subunit 9
MIWSMSPPVATSVPIPLMDEEPESLLRLPAHNSQPELSVGLVRRGTSPILGAKRNPNPVGLPTAQMRQSSLGVPTSRNRQSLIGSASSHGRLFKVLGDFFILAGRTERYIRMVNSTNTRQRERTEKVMHLDVRCQASFRGC